MSDTITETVYYQDHLIVNKTKYPTVGGNGEICRILFSRTFGVTLEAK